MRNVVYLDEHGAIVAVSPGTPLPVTGSYTTKEVTMVSGQSLSGECDIGNDQLFAVQMPAQWTEANLTFQAATASGGTFQDVYNGGAEYVFPVAAAKCCTDSDNALALAPLRFIKIRSGTAAAAVNQAATRTLTLILKR